MPLLGVDASHHAFEVTSFALRVGYRHFVLDFQKMRTFGRSLFESQIPRKNVFLSTRIPKDILGYRHSTRVLQKIQEEMPGGYADLCLVPGNAITLPAERAGTWHALEEAFDERICLSIGVSNYTVSHLDEMIHYARIEPSVNQIEFAPFMPVRELVEYCQDRNITVQAFGWMHEEILTDLSVQKRAGEFRATPLTPSQFVTLCFLSQNIAPLFSPNEASELMEHAEVVELENNCFDWPYLPRPKQSHLSTPWIEAFVSGPKRGRRLLRSENDRNERNERNEKNQKRSDFATPRHLCRSSGVRVLGVQAIQFSSFRGVQLAKTKARYVHVCSYGGVLRFRPKDFDRGSATSLPQGWLPHPS